MRKSSNTNNLIQKQINLLLKKEAKLLNHPKDNYIKNKISPFKDKIESKIPEKLQDTLELAFQKGFKTIFDKGVEIIEKTYNKDNINMQHDINSYALNKYPTKKNLKKLDKSANKKTLFNKSITIIEGSSLGLLGIGLPDIPIYIGIILKSIYEISLSYGFDYKLSSEKAYVLNIICATVTSGNERKYYFEKLNILGSEIDTNLNLHYDVDELLIETSKKISTYMLTAKFIQGLPIVGVIGGVANFLTLQDITKIATLKYKKRYLNILNNENIPK